MAENNSPLSIIIDADISKLQKAISDVRDSIGQITSAIKQTDLGDFGKGLEESLSKINARLNELEGNLQKTSTTSKTFTTGTKDARLALNSLSLVAQDLPFGFIGIQNNLPGVIQSFGTLSVASKGLSGSIIALKAALIGPAGLFLAFSVVTSLVTFAIQKYGSFGNAISAIFGKISDLDKIQERANKSLSDYNKELTTNGEIIGSGSAKVSDQILKIQTLSEAIKNTTLSETQRRNAIEQLQKLDPKTLENLSLQTKNYKDLDDWVKKYTDSLIASAVAQEYLSKVVSVTTQINQQTNLLAEIGKGYADIAKRRREANAEPIFDPLTGAELTTTILGGLAIAEQNLNKEFKDQTTVVSDLWKQLNIFKNSAKDATIESLKFFQSTKGDPTKSDSFKFEIEPLVDILSLEQKISLLERLGTVILDTKSKESERIQALKELSDLEYDVFGGVELQNLTYNQLKSTLTGLGKTYQSLILQERQRVESLRLVDEAIKRQTYLNQVDREEFVRNYKEKRQEINKTAVSIPKQITVPVDFFINTENLKKILQSAQAGVAFGKEEKDINDREQKYLASVKKIGNAVETGLQKPFRDFFDTLIDEGKFTFDSFADFAKDAFKRILAQLAAAGIARLVTTILTGGIPVPVIGSSRIEQPRFDGVGASPLQLAGAVNLQLRGSDLVGSINRTNTTINRVG